MIHDCTRLVHSINFTWITGQKSIVRRADAALSLINMWLRVIRCGHNTTSGQNFSPRSVLVFEGFKSRQEVEVSIYLFCTNLVQLFVYKHIYYSSLIYMRCVAHSNMRKYYDCETDNWIWLRMCTDQTRPHKWEEIYEIWPSWFNVFSKNWCPIFIQVKTIAI